MAQTLLALAFSLALGSYASAQQVTKYSVRCTRETPPHMVIDQCVISHPEVRQPMTLYPEVVLIQGDVLTVEGLGCVQTGGKSLTWKKFVNPAGPNSDHLYSGLVWVRAVNQNPDLFPARRFQAGLNQFAIPAGSRAELRVGYEDDNYEDNGYWNPDLGTGNQCQGAGDASVTVRIVRSGLVSLGPPPAPTDPPGAIAGSFVFVLVGGTQNSGVTVTFFGTLTGSPTGNPAPSALKKFTSAVTRTLPPGRGSAVPLQQTNVQAGMWQVVAVPNGIAAQVTCSVKVSPNLTSFVTFVPDNPAGQQCK